MEKFTKVLSLIALALIIIAAASYLADRYGGTSLSVNIGPAGYVGPGASVAPERTKEPVCEVAGAVFVKELGHCVYHMADPVEVQRYSPDQTSDPRCKGKPPGSPYDEEVRDNLGKVGIAHKVCGKR